MLRVIGGAGHVVIGRALRRAGLLAVDVIDPATGTVRLKAKVADADEMALDTRSTKTARADN